MNLKHLFLVAINRAQQFINTPTVYVAAVFGTGMGIGVGGLAGAFSGGFIGYSLQACRNCMIYPWGIDANIIVGVAIGFLLGSLVGGGVISVITVYKIYKRTQKPSVLSQENMPLVLWTALLISIEMAIGIGLGTIIGSLKIPGYGSIAGAAMGGALMLFTSTLDKKSKK